MKYNVRRHAVMTPRDQSTREIPLTYERTAVVDAVDYEWLSKFNWRLKKCKKHSYAVYTDNRSRPKTKFVLMHRLILGLGPEDKTIVDHKNGNGLDNRRVNLRVATKGQNNYNAKPSPARNKSGYKGVSWHQRDKKWIAQISAKGHGRYLGAYDTKEEAAAAYQKAAIELHGEFARFE